MKNLLVKGVIGPSWKSVILAAAREREKAHPSYPPGGTPSSRQAIDSS